MTSSRHKDGRPKHATEAAYWLAHRRNDLQTAKHFKRDRHSIRRWRESEDWEGWGQEQATPLIERYLRILQGFGIKIEDWMVRGKIVTAGDAAKCARILQDELGGASKPEQVARIIIDHRGFEEPKEKGDDA